jgi:pimeloyl-ACP methyl ester carboxylesterase
VTTATAAAALAALITVMTLLFTGACTPDASRDGPGRATSTGAAPATEFGSAEPTGDGVAQLADRALSYDCTDVPPRETGQPTVVLLTGLDNDMTVWDQTRRHLGDVPVCAYDRANVGSSNRVDGPRPIDDSVDELHGFLQAADVPPPYMLVGHSYGGLVTMLYAAAYPQQVHSLLLVDGLLPFEDELDAISNGPRQLARVRAELNDNVEQLTIFGHLPDPRQVARVAPGRANRVPVRAPPRPDGAGVAAGVLSHPNARLHQGAPERRDRGSRRWPRHPRGRPDSHRTTGHDTPRR